MSKKLPRRPGGGGRPLPPRPKDGPKRPPGAAAPPPTSRPTKPARAPRRRTRGPRGSSGCGFKFLFLLVLVLLILVGAPGGYLFYRGQASLPQVAGTAPLPGLGAPVEVLRDTSGVPHLFASDMRDLARATGYVHAQDRLFQMEMLRRLGSGRMAELFGPELVELDRRVRRLSLPAAAQAEAERMAPEAREILEAYAAGVNAFVEASAEHPPLEFQLLDHQPALWTPVDSLVIVKWMADLISSNGAAELLRAALIEKVGGETAYLMTGLAPPPDLIDPSVSYLRPPRSLVRPSRGASNAWVVAGARSGSSRPLLASDPHLPLSMPSIWYEIHLSGGGLDVAGASIPGIPFVVIGHNQRVAWGVTALYADVQDHFVETVNPDNPRQYASGELWEDLESWTETINVADGALVTEEIVRSRHGVLVDNQPKDGRLYALRWDAIRRGDHTLALWRLNLAGSWEEFIEALRTWASPALAFVYADVEGNIGFFPAGDIPVRSGFDGTLPVDGASGQLDWQGSIPHELKPQLFNPEDGLIVSANHSMLPPDAPYPLGQDTLPPFRAHRIATLLSAGSSLSAADMVRIQSDRYDSSTESILRYLVALTPEDEQEAQALTVLRSWNGQMDAGAAPAIYQAVHRMLLENAFRDELGDELFDTYLEFLEEGHGGSIHAIIDEPASPLWDDGSTPEVEDRTSIFARSLTDGLGVLSSLQSGDMGSWDWATLHGADFDHPLGQEPPLSWLFSRTTLPFGGSTHTVSNATVSLREPFGVVAGTSFRFIADLSDLSQSQSIVPTGASGHPLSPHYFAQNRGWLAGEPHPLLTSRAGVEMSLGSRLVLQP